jgi:hypothetical protein
MTREELPRSAKSLLSGRSGRVYRLFKRTEMHTDGTFSHRYNIKIPRLLFGWKWLKRKESWPKLKMEWMDEGEARRWIESHKTMPPQEQWEEIQL